MVVPQSNFSLRPTVNYRRAPRSHAAWSAFYESEGVRSPPAAGKIPVAAVQSRKSLRSEARAGSVNPGAGSRRSLGSRLGVPVRRSPVYTITMCPIIPTHQMLSIAPNLLTTQRLILRPWRETDREGFARLNDDPAVMEFMPRRLSREESDAAAAGIQAAIERRGW